MITWSSVHSININIFQLFSSGPEELGNAIQGVWSLHNNVGL